MNKPKMYNKITSNCNKKYKLIIKAFTYNSLQYIIKNIEYLNNTETSKIAVTMLPLKTKTITLLRSPHKYKKAQEHFNIKIYTAIINISKSQLNSAATTLINKPFGLFIKIKCSSTQEDLSLCDDLDLTLQKNKIYN